MTYEAYSYAEEFNIYSTLSLKEDGNFVYYESWSSYGGGFGYEARGVWRQSGNLIFMLPDYVEKGWMRVDWAKQKECRATVQDDQLIFDNSFAMSLNRAEYTASNQSVEIKEIAEPTSVATNEKAEPASVANKKPQFPAVANLHFKDGRICEIQTPKNSLLGLSDVTFYRLVDENGKIANVFKLRQESENPDSKVLEFDEIDFTPSEEPDNF